MSEATVLPFKRSAAPMPEWEIADRARRAANLCADPKCRAVFPLHTAECETPSNPAAERCSCGLIKDSFGCRRNHRRQSAATDGPGDAA